MTEPNRLTVAVAIIVEQSCVLLVHRRANDGAPPWVLPGGKVEPGESAGQAAAREVLEETGLTVRAVRILGERIHPDTGAHLVYVACEVIAGTARVASAGEVEAVEWVPVGNLGGYVPHGFFEPVGVYLGEVLASGG